MTTPRKRYSADFKSKIALEAVKGTKTVNEIASIHGLHPNQWSAGGLQHGPRQPVHEC